MGRLVAGFLFMGAVSSGLTDAWLNGLIATTMSMTQYIFTLDGVKGILRTKDPAKVDLVVAIACIFNSLAWGAYALLVQDLFVFVPNIAAFGAGFCQIFLFMWTTGRLSDSSAPIKFLHKCFLKQTKMLPTKLKEESEIEAEGLFACAEPHDDNSHVLILRDERPTVQPTAAQAQHSKQEQS